MARPSYWKGFDMDQVEVGARDKEKELYDSSKLQGTAAGTENKNWRPSTRERIEKAAVHTQAQRINLVRIGEILSKHPEFEEFLELQDLLNRTIY